jgi:hypothetical protein
MRKPNTDKKEFKWNRSRFGELSHVYNLNGKEIASIFPKETKDGRIHWGFWIDRIEGHREINTNNCKQFESLNINPTYPKRKDAKKKIEEVVSSIIDNGKSV